MPEITNADNAVSTVPKKQKVGKHTYCKRCGNLINNKTKKCEGCGKQYFHLPKVTLVRVLLVLLIVGLTGANVYQYIEKQNSDLFYQNKISDTEKTLAEYRSNWFDAEVEKGKYQSELSFWNGSAVICTTTGTKYHHYGCEHLKDVKSIYIYNVENAKAQGYTPCLDCCG